MVSPADEMENMFRLMAVEMLIVDTLASRYLASPDPIAMATAHREHFRRVLSEIALPFYGSAAASELVVGGIGDAIDRLLENAGQTAVRRVDEERRGGAAPQPSL